MVFRVIFVSQRWVVPHLIFKPRSSCHDTFCAPPAPNVFACPLSLLRFDLLLQSVAGCHPLLVGLAAIAVHGLGS